MPINNLRKLSEAFTFYSIERCTNNLKFSLYC